MTQPMLTLRNDVTLLPPPVQAKVSDFGLAKLSPDKGEYVSTRVLGTQGYVGTNRLSLYSWLWSVSTTLGHSQQF